MSRGTLTHPSAEDDARVDIVDKRPCFRMMVWLCAYYEFYEKKVHKCSIQYTTPLLTLLAHSTGDLRAAMQCSWKPAWTLPQRGGLHSTHPMLLGPQNVLPSWVTQLSPERWCPSSAVCTTWTSADRWRNLLQGFIVEGWLVYFSSSSGFFLTRPIGHWPSPLSSQPCGCNSRLPLPV